MYPYHYISVHPHSKNTKCRQNTGLYLYVWCTCDFFLSFFIKHFCTEVNLKFWTKKNWSLPKFPTLNRMESQFLVCLTTWKMPNIVFTVHALHFVVHTVLAVPKLFLEIINIFCMLQFVYAKINNFFVRFFFLLNKAIFTKQSASPYSVMMPVLFVWATLTHLMHCFYSPIWEPCIICIDCLCPCELRVTGSGACWWHHFPPPALGEV